MKPAMPVAFAASRDWYCLGISLRDLYVDMSAFEALRNLLQAFKGTHLDKSIGRVGIGEEVKALPEGVTGVILYQLDDPEVQHGDVDHDPSCLLSRWCRLYG